MSNLFQDYVLNPTKWHGTPSPASRHAGWEPLVWRIMNKSTNKMILSCALQAKLPQVDLLGIVRIIDKPKESW